MGRLSIEALASSTLTGLSAATDVLGGYVRGTTTVALVDAVLIGVGLAVLGVPLAVSLAMVVFVGALIPVLGATVAGVLAALVTRVLNKPVDAAIAIAVVVGVNQVESNLLQSVVMGRTLRLYPLIVLLALVIGTTAGGIVGAILANPYTALAWIMIRIWTDGNQSGDDPVLGKDPRDPRTRSTTSQLVKYQLMRLSRQRRPGPRAVGRSTPEGDVGPEHHPPPDRAGDGPAETPGRLLTTPPHDPASRSAICSREWARRPMLYPAPRHSSPRQG